VRKTRRENLQFNNRLLQREKKCKQASFNAIMNSINILLIVLKKWKICAIISRKVKVLFFILLKTISKEIYSQMVEKEKISVNSKK